MYVCVCNTVTDRRIREAIAAGADSFEALQEELDVSTCCGSCEPEVRAILAEAKTRALARAPFAGGPPLRFHAA
jgi:bacterioferritin-associated ferredoxin